MTGERRPSRAARGGGFLFFWLTIGFTLGTFVLLWPVRWLTDAIHRSGGSQQLENGLVIGLVVVYVAASAALALKLNRVVCDRCVGALRYLVVIVALLATASTAWAWRDPSRMLSGLAGSVPISSVTTQSGAIFEFGPYPDSSRLAELKRSGVKTVVSLQHPDDLVERRGIEEESRLTKALDLSLVRAPMLPWFSENAEALETIRTLVRTGSGRYYIHCGLGRDRVNIVKKLIESMGAVATTTDLKPALGFEGREADFQQGALVSLAPSVWLIPYPEKEELYGCIFEGRPGHVVLILDSTSAPQDSLLREGRRLLASYGIPFSVIPLRDTTPAAASAVVRAVRAIAPPVTVIAYHTPWNLRDRHAGDEAAVAFRDAFSPNKSWKITTAPRTTPMVANQETGGTEKGC